MALDCCDREHVLCWRALANCSKLLTFFCLFFGRPSSRALFAASRSVGSSERRVRTLSTISNTARVLTAPTTTPPIVTAVWSTDAGAASSASLDAAAVPARKYTTAKNSQILDWNSRSGVFDPFSGRLPRSGDPDHSRNGPLVGHGRFFVGPIGMQFVDATSTQVRELETRSGVPSRNLIIGQEI